MIVPTRRRGVELLDDPSSDAALVTRSLRDVAQANRWFGGTAAVVAEVDSLLEAGSAPLTLLDVGTGAGDIPEQVRQRARRRGVELTTIGLERTTSIAAGAATRARFVCVGDGLHLPFRDKSMDIVTCSQVLHHFADDEATTLIREMHRVARRLAVVADLRRSWIAAAGIWVSSFALRFHPVSRHDGVLSVLRGYRRHELAALVHRAVGIRPRARNRLGFRVTAAWAPNPRGSDAQLQS
jgi:SAM-dependent methyltransferase